MQGNRVVVSRILTSSKFDAPRSMEERIREFVEANTAVSMYPFSADYSVKVARGKPASADNKPKRNKAAGKNKRFGMGIFDPKATQKPGQSFYPYVRQFNRSGSAGDKPNIGWLDPIRTIKPQNLAAAGKAVAKAKSQGPQIVVRAGKKNPRTGTIEEKALGRSIGQAMGNIGQAAARAIGIVVDPNGRFRCPPGVPAANQFTDEVGSNCFDFSPAVGRALVSAAQNLFADVREQVREIDSVVPTERDRDGKLRLRSTSGGLVGPDGRPLVTPPPSPETILGPDGLPMKHVYPDISPDEYASEVRRILREIHPDWPESRIDEYAKTAEQRARMYDKTVERIQTALDYLDELGIPYDKNSPESMQVAVAEALVILKDRGWDIDLSGFYQLSSDFTGMDGKLTRGNAKDAVRRHNESIIQTIVALTSERILEGAEPDVSADGFQRWFDKKIKANPRYDGELSARFLEAMRDGLSASTFSDPYERLLYEKSAMRYRQYQSTEVGFLTAFLTEHKMDPERAEQIKSLELASPFDVNGNVDMNNLTYNAELSVNNRGMVMVWNPLSMIINQPISASSTGPFRLFETNNRGTEIARLKEISESVSATARKELLDNYLNGLTEFANDAEEMRRGEGYNEEFMRKHFGRIAQGTYVNSHEFVHADQISAVAYAITHDRDGRDLGKMNNAEALTFALEVLAGKNGLVSYQDMLSDPHIWKRAIDDLPTIMKTLLDSNLGGRYPKDEYYRAVILNDIISQRTPEARYQKMVEYWNELNQLAADGMFETAWAQGINVVLKNYITGPDGNYVDLSDKTLLSAFRNHNSLVFAELQAEIGAALSAGLIEETPEVEAILAPIRTARRLPDQAIRDADLASRPKKRGFFGLRSASSSGVVDDSSDRFGYETDEVFDSKLTDSVLDSTVELTSRRSASTWGARQRERVLDNATPQQRQILEADWRAERWASEPMNLSNVSISLTTMSGDNSLDKTIRDRVLPFSDLVASSRLDEGVAVEISVSGNDFGQLGEDISGLTMDVDTHFTGVIKTDSDMDIAQPNTSLQSQRLIINVPAGNAGLPDFTPGTQNGEVGSMILPPGRIEVLGRRSDGTIMARVVSQKTPLEQLEQLENSLREISDSPSRPLQQRVRARTAMGAINSRRRSETMRSVVNSERYTPEYDNAEDELAAIDNFLLAQETAPIGSNSLRLSSYYAEIDRARKRKAELERMIRNGSPYRPAKPQRDTRNEFEKFRDSLIDRGTRSGTGFSGLRSTRAQESVQTSPQQAALSASDRTVDILSRLESIGVDLDRREQEKMDQISDFLRLGLSRIGKPNIEQPTSKEESDAFAARMGFTPERRLEVLKDAGAKGSSDLDVWRSAFTSEEKGKFESRLLVAREMASGRGDTETVRKIDEFVAEVGKMSDEEFSNAVTRAAERMESPFDEKPMVAVENPLAILDSGRYLTVHERDRLIAAGGEGVPVGISERTGWDPETVIGVRRGTEQELLGIPANDTSDDVTSLRPASGYMGLSGSRENRKSKLRSLYGDDVEIQHDYVIGSEADNIRNSGPLGEKRNAIASYGDSTIILRPQVADRTMVARGDTVSDAGTYTPLLRATRMSGNKHQASFFDEMSILYADRTGDTSSIASPGMNSGKPYMEAMIMGSFASDDIQAISAPPYKLRTSTPEKMSIIGARPTADSNVTSIIEAAKKRDELAGRDIDVVLNSSVFPLDEVEPFNSKMTRKWVESQIANGEWEDVSIADVVTSDDTTPYEAWLRYTKRRGSALFDHPDNDPADPQKNKRNLISMIDKELARISYSRVTGSTPVAEAIPPKLQSRRATLETSVAGAEKLRQDAAERATNLEKALQILEETGEWKGGDLGVSVAVNNNWSVNGVDNPNITPRNLSASEIAEIGGKEDLITAVKAKIKISQIEARHQDDVARRKRIRREQGVLDVEDIPEDVMDELRVEAARIAALDTDSDEYKELFRGTEPDDAFVYHAGASELDGGVLDPRRSVGSMEGASQGPGDTRGLNNRQVEIARDSIAKRKPGLDALTSLSEWKKKNPQGGRFVASSKEEAKQLETFGLVGSAFRVDGGNGLEYDIPESVFSQYGYRELENTIKREQQFLDKYQAVLDMAESVDGQFLSSYPAGKEIVSGGYFGRFAPKTVPEDIASVPSEFESRIQGAAQQINDRDAYDRWMTSRRGTAWLIGGKEGKDITSLLGPGDERQILGEQTPIFGISQLVSPGTRYTDTGSVRNDVLQEVGPALMARAIRLRREGRDVSPEAVISSPLPDTRGRSSGLRSARTIDSREGLRSRRAERRARVGAESAQGVYDEAAYQEKKKKTTGLRSGRSTESKLTDGPENLPHGRGEDGSPRVAETRVLEQKFGRTFREQRKYFKKTYGVDIDGKIPEMPIARESYYGSLQALDDLLQNINAKELLAKENLTFKFSTAKSIWDESWGSFALNRNWFIKFGRQKSVLNISNADISEEASEMMSLLKYHGVAKMLDNMTISHSMKLFANRGKLAEFENADLGSGGEELIAKRLGYGTMVHEFAHLLDYLARPDKKKLRLPPLSTGIQIDEEKQKEFEKRSSLTSMLSEVFDQFSAVSTYGSSKNAEKLAEAFTAWWLFGREVSDGPIRVHPIIRFDENSRWERQSPEDIRDIMRPVVEQLFEALQDGIKSAEQNDIIGSDKISPIIKLYAASPFIIREEA